MSQSPPRYAVPDAGTNDRDNDNARASQADALAGLALGQALADVLRAGDAMIGVLDAQLHRPTRRSVDLRIARRMLEWRAASDRLLRLFDAEGLQ